MHRRTRARARRRLICAAGSDGGGCVVVVVVVVAVRVPVRCARPVHTVSLIAGRHINVGRSAISTRITRHHILMASLSPSTPPRSQSTLHPVRRGPGIFVSYHARACERSEHSAEHTH